MLEVSYICKLNLMYKAANFCTLCTYPFSLYWKLSVLQQGNCKKKTKKKKRKEKKYLQNELYIETDSGQVSTSLRTRRSTKYQPTKVYKQHMADKMEIKELNMHEWCIKPSSFIRIKRQLKIIFSIFRQHKIIKGILEGMKKFVCAYLHIWYANEV